jgi:pimeloyl-ACP methyl ester carboxylesterase
VIVSIPLVASALVCAGALGCSSSPIAIEPPRASAGVRYERVSVDGVRIFLREAGPPGAPVLVLLHGFPSSSHMFRQLIPLLATRFRVIAPDYPGFGNSDRPDPGAFSYTFDHLSRVVERLLEDRGIDRFALFMHDYGGPIGLRMAARHPDRISALVVQNANAYQEGLSEAFFKLKRPLWAARTAATEAPILSYLKDGRFRSQYTSGMRSPESSSPDGPNLDAWGLEQPNGLAIQLALQVDYRSNLELYPEWQRYLREHRPPTLVVWGKNDPIFTSAGALAYKRDLPDCEVHLLDTGHFPLEEDAAATADLVMSFLDRRLLPAPRNSGRQKPPAS